MEKTQIGTQTLEFTAVGRLQGVKIWSDAVTNKVIIERNGIVIDRQDKQQLNRVINEISKLDEVI